MSDTNPTAPGGAVPPKPPEASKIQPKKETVRINLPPKPSAAPTIKLPTLPPGGPSAGAPVVITPAPAAAAPVAAAPAARAGAAPVAAPTTQKPVQRPVVVAAPAMSGVDRILAIAAGVAGIIAIGSTVYCMMLFKD